MKATGMVRKIDELGRIVIPKEIRRIYRIANKDPLEIFTDGDRIILQKYQVSCVLCGEQENLKNLDGKMICSACICKAAELIEDET